VNAFTADWCPGVRRFSVTSTSWGWWIVIDRETGRPRAFGTRDLAFRWVDRVIDDELALIFPERSR